MAMNGGVTVVLLSLIFPAIAYTDHYQRPTPRMRARQYMTENVNRNRHLDSLNETTPHTYLDARSVNNNQRDQDYDGQIVYPDTRTTCTHGLCTNVVGYPKDRIKKLLSRSQFMNGYFEATEELVNIDNRFGSDEMSLCDTMVHTIYPEKANNTNKIEKVIVNVEGHKQGIVFETCVNNEKCKFSSTFPNGYISYCKQKYIHKRLMVLGDNDKFVFDSFEVPSCCVCTVKKDN